MNFFSRMFEELDAKSRECPRLWEIDYKTVTRIEISYGAALGDSVYMTAERGEGKAQLNHDERSVPLNFDDFAQKLCDIVAIWEEEMGNRSVLDGTFYCVKIHCSDKRYEFRGDNKFPYNFFRFTLLLSEYNIID